MEYTISQQQQEIRGLHNKLSSHDSAAKRAINGLQTEMKLRIDQVRCYNVSLTSKYIEYEENLVLNIDLKCENFRAISLILFHCGRHYSYI